MSTEHFKFFLITKIPSDQFGALHFTKMFLSFDILTWSPTSSLGSFSLFYIPKWINVLDLTLKGLYVMVLRYVLLYSQTISSNLSACTFCDIEVIHL